MRRAVTATALVLFLTAFVLWSGLEALGVFRWIDEHSLMPEFDPASSFGQILAAFSIVTYPGVMFAVVLGIAAWCFQRRLRRLALALAITVVVGWGGYWLLKQVFQRSRPESTFSHVITYDGYAYPSGHAVAATIVAMTLVTIGTAQRRSLVQIWLIRAVGAFFVALVALDRMLMRHHWFSDVVGGVLFGGVVLLGVLYVSGIHTLADSLGLADQPRQHVDKRAAIIYNPSKVLSFDLFRKRVEFELRTRGWKPPLWLETAEDDPGRRMAQDALAQGVNLVLVAGGDGTVRTVCSELVGSGVPVGLVPAGTGNLLARNLGVSLDEQVAFDTAFTGRVASVDVVKFTTDDQTGHFVVMSGIGADAKVMAETNPDLKKVVGSAAYFVAAAQAMSSGPFEVRVRLDDDEILERQAMMAVVGNVGSIQGGIKAFPSAEATDGQLDVLVANPNGVADWAKVASGLLGGTEVEPLEYAQGTRVLFEVSEPMPYQLDGDAEGSTTRFEAEVVPGGLTVMLPK